MPDASNSAVGLFSKHVDAETAVKALQRSGFDMRNLSVIGKEAQTTENVIGYYNTGDRMAAWGKYSLFWRSMWAIVLGSAFVVVPGIGPLLVGGPMVAWLVNVLESAAVVPGGTTALGGALASIGIPRESIVVYETSIRANKFVLIVHGTREEAARARRVLLMHRAEDAAVHGHGIIQPTVMANF